jgi:hypothetical protein
MYLSLWIHRLRVIYVRINARALNSCLIASPEHINRFMAVFSLMTCMCCNTTCKRAVLASLTRRCSCDSTQGLGQNIASNLIDLHCHQTRVFDLRVLLVMSSLLTAYCTHKHTHAHTHASGRMEHRFPGVPLSSHHRAWLKIGKRNSSAGSVSVSTRLSLVVHALAPRSRSCCNSFPSLHRARFSSYRMVTFASSKSKSTKSHAIWLCVTRHTRSKTRRRKLLPLWLSYRQSGVSC